MSLISRKDRKRYMAELLPPETWREAFEALVGEDWLDGKEDPVGAAFMSENHKKRRTGAIKRLATLFDNERFDVSQFEVLDVIPVLNMGWEGDYLAWVVKYRGGKYVIGTDHGCQRLMTTEELKGLVMKYEQAIAYTNKAISEVES